MICRMTKEQREALVELIRCMINDARAEAYTSEVEPSIAKDEFHRLFANEDDLNDNVRST